MQKSIGTNAARFALLAALLSSGQNPMNFGGSREFTQRTMPKNGNGGRTHAQNLKRRRMRKLVKQARRINRK